METEIGRVIDTLPGLVWTASSDGEADFLNRRWLEYTGLAEAEAMGIGWHAVIHPDDAPAALAHWREKMGAGLPGQVELRLRRIDGAYRWFQVRFAPVTDEAGRIVRWCGINTDVDDLKRAEAQRATERDLKLIIDTTPALIWSANTEGVTTSVNQHFLDYVGFSQEELSRSGWAIAIHPDDQERIVAQWRTARQAGNPGHVEGRLRRHDGEYRWFLMRVSPLRDENGTIVRWYGVNTDIEDQKRAEQALAGDERNLRQTIDAIPTLAWCNRTDGSNEFLNKRWHDYTGLPPEQANGWGWQVTLHPDDLPVLLAKWAHMLASGEAGEMEARLRRHDGVYRWFLFRCDPLRDDTGAIVKWYGTNTDVEDLKQAEAAARASVSESRKAEEALSRVRSELAHVTRVASLNALTASIAHEVNQPLAGIITNAATCLRMLAADPPDVAGAQETARRTIRDGNRASDVIARLRALFSRKTTTVESVDLNEAAREVIALTMHELRSHGIQVQELMNPRLPPVAGDRVQLQQVILNLIMNATDAMGAVVDRPRQLLVATELDDKRRVQLAVRDTGIGVDAANIAGLFDAFYTTKPGGMGIGLSVSRSIIEGHRGRLWAKPNDGPGATFLFSIPSVPDGSPPREPSNGSTA